MSNQFVINTIHRGRLIQILLGSLFLIGGLASYLEINEIHKILILLCSLPLILFASVRFSQQPSIWSFDHEALHIQKGSKEYYIPFQNIEYIKNNIRSGGNLMVIFSSVKKAPIRFWRNKLFQAIDDLDAMTSLIREMKIPYVIG